MTMTMIMSMVMTMIISMVMMVMVIVTMMVMVMVAMMMMTALILLKTKNSLKRTPDHPPISMTLFAEMMMKKIMPYIGSIAKSIT